MMKIKEMLKEYEIIIKRTKFFWDFHSLYLRQMIKSTEVNIMGKNLIYIIPSNPHKMYLHLSGERSGDHITNTGTDCTLGLQRDALRRTYHFTPANKAWPEITEGHSTEQLACSLQKCQGQGTQEKPRHYFRSKGPET